jgi:hypothetical protein
MARLTSCSTGMKKPGATVNITAQMAASGADAFSSSTWAEMLRNAYAVIPPTMRPEPTANVPLGNGFSRRPAAAVGFSFSAISVVSVARPAATEARRLDDPATIFAQATKVVVIDPIRL